MRCVGMRLTRKLAGQISCLSVRQSRKTIYQWPLLYDDVRADLKRFILRFSANRSAPDLLFSGAPATRSSSEPVNSSSPSDWCSSSARSSSGLVWEAVLEARAGLAFREFSLRKSSG